MTPWIPWTADDSIPDSDVVNVDNGTRGFFKGTGNSGTGKAEIPTSINDVWNAYGEWLTNETNP